MQLFEALVYRWALESITSIFLNTRLGCLDQNPSADTKTLINGANIILGPDMYRLITWPPFYKYVELPYFKRFDRACSDVYKLCSKHINEAADKFDRDGGQVVPQKVASELHPKVRNHGLLGPSPG